MRPTITTASASRTAPRFTVTLADGSVHPGLTRTEYHAVLIAEHGYQAQSFRRAWIATHVRPEATR